VSLSPDDVDLADLDVFGQGRAWPLFDVLREQAPVHWNPEPAPNHGFWSITRHADIVRVTRDEETFSSELGGANLEELDDEQLEVRKSMLETDGARHMALRRLIQRDFNARALVGYEAFLRGLTRTTVDAALAQGSFDFVKAISADFPIRVLARLLDVPQADTGRLIEWGNRMVGNSDPDYADVLADSEESEQYRLLPFRSPAALEVFEYGRELAAQRRPQPGDDLMSKLVTAEIDGEPLTQRELDNYFLLLALAGQETTRQAISLAMLTLIQNPAALGRLQEKPELLAGPALDEILRWGPPVYHMRRTATRDVEVGGVRMKAGDKVAMWYASGNRDERAIPNPDVLDLDRTGVDLLTFGKGGPHYCLGSFLAKLELRVTLEELLRRLPDFRLAPGEKPEISVGTGVGVDRLPLVFTPAR
jgi:cytochrome P450